MISLKKSYKFAIVALLVLIIAFFDYATALHLSKIDIVYRELYFIPILIGAYWFGKREEYSRLSLHRPCTSRAPCWELLWAAPPILAICWK